MGGDFRGVLPTVDAGIWKGVFGVFSSPSPTRSATAKAEPEGSVAGLLFENHAPVLNVIFGHLGASWARFGVDFGVILGSVFGPHLENLIL